MSSPFRTPRKGAVVGTGAETPSPQLSSNAAQLIKAMPQRSFSARSARAAGGAKVLFDAAPGERPGDAVVGISTMPKGVASGGRPVPAAQRQGGHASVPAPPAPVPTKRSSAVSASVAAASSTWTYPKAHGARQLAQFQAKPTENPAASKGSGRAQSSGSVPVRRHWHGPAVRTAGGAAGSAVGDHIISAGSSATNHPCPPPPRLVPAAVESADHKEFTSTCVKIQQKLDKLRNKRTIML